MVITPSGSLQGLARLFMERGFVLIELLDGELKRPREWKEGLTHLFELLQPPLRRRFRAVDAENLYSTQRMLCLLRGPNLP